MSYGPGQIEEKYHKLLAEDSRPVPDSYRRYLERGFIDAFKLKGPPLRIEFRTSRNPYAERRSK